MGTGAEYKRRQQEEAAKAAAKEAAGDKAAGEPPAKRQRLKRTAKAGESAPPAKKGQFPLPVAGK